MKKEKVARLQDRLRDALTIRGMKAAELSKKTDIDRGTISYYMSGKSSPKEDKLYLICSTLNVSEAWMLGYDVPMDRLIEQNDDDIYHLNLIMQNGEVKIPSIFMFENSRVYTKFLECARHMNCVVVFENENLVVDHSSDYYRFKLYAYEQMLDNRDIGNAYLRYLGNIDKMNWDAVKK